MRITLQRSIIHHHLPNGGGTARQLSSRGFESNALGDCPKRNTIVPFRLVRKPEESKKDESAQWRDPAGELHRHHEHVIPSPNHRRDLFNAGKREMGVGKASPWSNGCGGDVQPNHEDGEGGCE
jgi:hypothetical protein